PTRVQDPARRDRREPPARRAAPRSEPKEKAAFLDPQDDLTHSAALVELPQGSRALLEGVDGADDWPDPAGPDQLAQSAGRVRDAIWIGSEHAERASADVDVPQEQAVDLDLGDLARGEADDDDPSLRCERSQALLEALGAPDRIDDQIDGIGETLAEALAHDD